MSLALVTQNFQKLSPLILESERSVSLAGSTPYLAALNNLTMEQVEQRREKMPLVKDKKTGTMKKPSRAAACKALILENKTMTEAEMKAAYKQYDSLRTEGFENMRRSNVLLAADPNVRVTLRGTKNAKGIVTRIHATYAPAGQGLSKDQRIKQLEATIARLTTQKAKETVVAATTESV